MESQSLPSLRPLLLGELLDQAIRLYRRNFLTFVGIIALIIVPIIILQAAAGILLSSSLSGLSSADAEQIFSNYGYWVGMGSIFILVFVQIILVQGIATGVMARAVGDSYLGKKTGIFDAYRGIGKSWVSLLGAILLIFIIAFIIMLWGIIPCIGWFTGLGMLMFFSGAVSPMVAPSVVLEGQGAINAIHRAWSLARRRFWPLLGYIFVLHLFSLIIVNGPSMVVNVLLTGLLSSFDTTTQAIISTIAQSLVSLITTLIYYPLQMTAFTLIYFDLRVRTEGFDIALSTMQVDPASENQLMPAPPLATDERLITGPDLGNFAILTLGAAGIYILFISIVMMGVLLASSLL